MKNVANNRNSRWPRQLALLVAAWVCSLATAGGALGQETWEYSPYRVRLWLAVRDATTLSTRAQTELLEQIQKRSRLFAGATWRLEVQAAPSALTGTLTTLLDQVTVEQIAEVSQDALDQDKLILLTVGRQEDAYDVACRELDCHARSFSLVYRCRVQQLPLLGRQCAVRRVGRVRSVGACGGVARTRLRWLAPEPADWYGIRTACLQWWRVISFGRSFAATIAAGIPSRAAFRKSIGPI